MKMSNSPRKRQSDEEKSSTTSNRHSRISKPKRRKTSEAPHRPLSAYSFFFREMKSTLLRENHSNIDTSCSSGVTAVSAGELAHEVTGTSELVDGNSSKSHHVVHLGSMGRAMGKLWRELGPEARRKYEVMAEQDLKRYIREMHTYDEMQGALVGAQPQAVMSLTSNESPLLVPSLSTQDAALLQASQDAGAGALAGYAGRLPMAAAPSLQLLQNKLDLELRQIQEQQHIARQTASLTNPYLCPGQDQVILALLIQQEEERKKMLLDQAIRQQLLGGQVPPPSVDLMNRLGPVPQENAILSLMIQQEEQRQQAAAMERLLLLQSQEEHIRDISSNYNNHSGSGATTTQQQSFEPAGQADVANSLLSLSSSSVQEKRAADRQQSPQEVLLMLQLLVSQQGAK